MVSGVLGALIQRAIVSCYSLPCSMKIVRHHVYKVQVPVCITQYFIVTNELRLTRKQRFTLLCNFWDVITSINSSFPSSHSCTEQQSCPSSCCPLRLVCFQKFLFVKKLWSLVQVKSQDEHAVINKLELDTLHKRVNRSLSSSGLPLAAGYSQSRSSPSNPCVLRN